MCQEENNREIRNHSLNDNKIIVYQNLEDEAKTVLPKNCVALNCHVSKEESLKIIIFSP